ncbi:MAG: T9SS type A sorting domain-containing protein [Bacteroidota bacterium]
MKKIAFLTALLFATGVAFAQCPSGPIELNSQTDVDNFVIDYPGCTELLDHLIIDGNSITNFKGLSSITSIGQRLAVSNTQITNFQGFEFLESVGETLDIRNNNNLIDLTGLESLTTVLHLFVISNSSLKTLNGLDALATIEEPESFVIHDNGSLVSIDALETVNNCPDCSIDIRENSSLTNLFGLQNIPAEDIDYLLLRDNPILLVCNLDNICQFLGNGGEHLIENNASGCSSAQEIIGNCGVFAIEDQSLAYKLKISPNPVSQELQIQLPGALALKQASIYSISGALLFSSSETILDFSSLSEGIYFLAVQTDRGSMTRRVVKTNR